MNQPSIVDMVRESNRAETNSETPAELLYRARLEIAPQVFYLIGLSFDDWMSVLQQPELSSNREVPYMILRDAHEITLLLDEVDWRAMRHAASNARVEGEFRLLTFDLELSWNVTGFLAHVTKILADADITCGALSAFSRDHLLIKQSDLPQAMLALGKHIEAEQG